MTLMKALNIKFIISKELYYLRMLLIFIALILQHSIESFMPGENKTLDLEIVKGKDNTSIAQANGTLSESKPDMNTISITSNGSPVMDTRYENIFDLAERLRRNIIHNFRKIEWQLKSLFGRHKRGSRVYPTEDSSDEDAVSQSGNRTQSDEVPVEKVENPEGSSNSSRRMQTQEWKGAQGLFLGSKKKEHKMQGMEPGQGREKKRLRGKVGTKGAKLLKKHEKPAS